MKVEISKFAQRELEDAILYYELEQKGLGLRFKDEVKIFFYKYSTPSNTGLVNKKQWALLPRSPQRG